MDPLTRTWAQLIALTMATTALAGASGRLVMALLLLLAFLKARLILGRFLHLAERPSWLSVFAVPVGIWLFLIAAGYGIVLR